MGEARSVRINKYLSEAGIASRREADGLIKAGRVTVILFDPGSENGGKACPIRAETGMQIGEKDRIFVDGIEITGQRDDKVYLMLNKPKGLVCTSDPSEPDNVIRYVGSPVRLTYAGRLDKDSRGLLLLTNDGDLIHRMMKGSMRHEKEYLCRLRDPVTEAFLHRIRRGVTIRVPDAGHQIKLVKTRPCQVGQVDDHTVSIVLTQGLNRQIRRMCFALGQQVVDLKRVRVMTLKLGGLEEGTWRSLTESEIRELRAAAGCESGKNKTKL